MSEEHIKHIKGSWSGSCQSHFVKDNKFYAYLRNIKGNLNLDYIDNIDKINEDKYFTNLNGFFRCSTNNNFPKNIFQTHKSYDYINSNQKILNAIHSWMKYSYKFNYQFYTNEMCEEFIKNNFDDSVYEAYMKLPIQVMKADLWRYCILYKYGGIYADADTICKIDPSELIHDNTFLICAPEGDNIHLCQWIFAAPMHSPILKNIIDLSVKRILSEEMKGEHFIHYFTGPGVFTDGIENYLKKNNLPTYKNKKDYSKYSYSDLSVFDHDSFHWYIIQHLFAGNDNNGWKNERQKLIKK
jgi:mannosyltransferase OCH1-like enzyme